MQNCSVWLTDTLITLSLLYIYILDSTTSLCLLSVLYALICALLSLSLLTQLAITIWQEMEATYVVNVDGIRCTYFDQVDRLHNFGSQNNESIARLLWGFFHYWAYYHDYTNDVISVRTGQNIR